MALMPPDEIEKLHYKYYKEVLERIMPPMSTTWWTTTSTTSTSFAWGNNGGYYYTSGDSLSSSGISSSKTQSIKYKTKTKEPDYIPSDEGDGKRKSETDFKFNPAFLELEGEVLNVE
jgi:hypothetical protein